MISRYQRILFIVLLGSSVLMVVFLIISNRRAYNGVQSADDTPIEAPTYAASESVTLDLANDNDASLTPTNRLLALPTQPAVRARALLEHLLAEYTLPHATHAVGGGIAVEDVYLVTLPLTSATPKGTPIAIDSAALQPTRAEDSDPLTHDVGELALVNLRGAWVDAHPSGITAETLTIQSIVGTLHANLPEITKVRFLVDGQSRATLAGNVELDRTYDAATTASTNK